MSEASEAAIAREIEEAEHRGEAKIVANLLRMNETADRILQASGWSLEKVVNLAREIGMKELRLR
ncbi:MAG: hypothetical protein IJ083_08660 [Clostridia bacterium]|nr:hypothetical protein [Clostridia bacterium]